VVRGSSPRAPNVCGFIVIFFYLKYMFSLLFLFKFFLCLSAVMVLVSKNPVHSVLFLILVFCNGAGILLLLGFEFLAMIFLVVYVGAIAVLFLFIVMMLNLKIPGFRQTLLNHYSVSFATLFFLFVEAGYYLTETSFGFSTSTFFQTFYRDWSLVVASQDNVRLLGNLLYTYYYLPFLVSGMVLLVAMLASIYLTLGSSGQTSKRQDVYTQVIRSNVVRLVYDPSPSLASNQMEPIK
jgi:NADH:ubiquinone oxidoreductase subunit 6 (subunit J)